MAEEWKDAPMGDTISIQKEEANKSYVGFYTGQKTVENEMGESILWKFQDENGKSFSIWGFGNLNMQLENVQVGTLCRITYLGKAEKKNKFGKYPHKAKVQINTKAKLEALPDSDEETPF